MKKLVIVTDNFLPRWDGISRFLLEIIPGLVDDFKISVICPKFGVVKSFDYKIIQVDISNYFFGDYQIPKFDFKKIKKEIKSADIVFCQTIGPVGALGIWYGSKYKKKVVSFVHSIEWELVPKATNNLFLKKILFPVVKLYSRYLHNLCDLLIVPSEVTGETISWSGLLTKKVVVNLGVDSDRFKPLVERKDEEKKHISIIRTGLGLDGFFVIGNHGRIAEEKDLVTLLNAFKWLKKHHSDCKLVIVGDGSKVIKDKLSKTRDVVLVGSRDDVEYYLNLFDVYVTSSLTETTSLTTLEAMSSELCVISTPVGFIKDYISNNVNGFLFRQGNSYELFKQIDLIKSNPVLKTSIGKKARRSVLKRFDWNKTRSDILSVLKEI